MDSKVAMPLLRISPLVHVQKAQNIHNYIIFVKIISASGTRMLVNASTGRRSSQFHRGGPLKMCNFQCFCCCILNAPQNADSTTFSHPVDMILDDTPPQPPLLQRRRPFGTVKF